MARVETLCPSAPAKGLEANSLEVHFPRLVYGEAINSIGRRFIKSGLQAAYKLAHCGLRLVDSIKENPPTHKAFQKLFGSNGNQSQKRLEVTKAFKNV